MGIEKELNRTDESNENTALIVYIKKILHDGFVQTFADDYAVKIFLALPSILNYLNTDPIQTDANGLILTPLNLLYIPAVTPLFGRSHVLAEWFEKLYSDKTTEIEKEISRSHIKKTFRNGCIYILFIAAPLVMTPLIFSEPLLILFNQNKNASAIAGNFLKNYANTVIPGFFSFFASQFFIASDKKNAMKIGSVILGSNLLLSVGFSFGLLGLPKWNENGVLVFYSIDAWLRALLYGATLFCHADFQELKLLNFLFQSLKKNGAEFYYFLMDSINPLITTLSEFLLMFALTASSIHFGVEKQAAFALATQCLSLNTIFNLNFAIAGMSLFGRMNAKLFNTNETSRYQLYSIAASAIMISTLVAMPLPLLFVLFPKTVAKIYANANNAKIINSVAAVSGMIALESVLKGPMYQMLFQSRAQQNGLLSGIIFAASLLLGYLVAMLLAFTMKKENDGLAAGFVSAMFFSNVFLFLLWKKGIWNVIEKKESQETRCKEKISSLVSTGIFHLQKYFFDATKTASNAHNLEVA